MNNNYEPKECGVTPKIKTDNISEKLDRLNQLANSCCEKANSIEGMLFGNMPCNDGECSGGEYYIENLINRLGQSLTYLDRTLLEIKEKL